MNKHIVRAREWIKAEPITDLYWVACLFWLFICNQLLQEGLIGLKGGGY